MGVAAAIFLVAFAIYVVTLAPTVFLIDSGLLTVAAAAGGNAHPPGFPLYLLLTHLATLLPVGSVAWRVNLASAVFAALATAAAALVVAEIILGTPVRRVVTERRKGKKGEPPAASAPALSVLAPAMVAAGLLLAFSRTLWAYATVAEVYALNTFLICALLAVALRWRRTRSTRLLYTAAVLAGAGLGVHYLTFGFALLGVLLLLAVSGGVALLRSRALLVAIVLGALTAMAVYAYLPLAARGNPALNWGDPQTPRTFFNHVSAKEYRGYITADEGGDQGGALRGFVVRELGPAIFPAAVLAGLIGLGALFLRDRAVFFAFGVIAVVTAMWFVVYPIYDDGDAYLLPVFVVLTIAAGYATWVLGRGRPAVAWALALTLPLVALLAHWKDRDRSDFRIGREYAEDLLRGIEPDSILITNDGHVWGSMMTLREAENVRRDVITIHKGSLTRPWYIDQFVRREPQLMALVQSELKTFRPVIDIIENDRPRAMTDTRLREEIITTFNDLMFALISRQIARGGHVYVTPDVALADLGAGGRIAARIRPAYDMVPGGLALQIVPRTGAVHPVSSVPFQVRGLDDPQVRRTGGKVVEEDIVPAYVTAYRLRARALAHSRRFDEARRSYDEALRLDPASPELRSEVEQFERFAADR